MLSTTSTTFETRYSAINTGGIGVTSFANTSPWTTPVSAGSHTISLASGATGGGATIKNLESW